MRKMIIIAATLAAFALAACRGGVEVSEEDLVVRTRGLTEPEQVTLETLPLLGTQVTLGQPFTIDASLFPATGAPTLTGELALEFMWTERGTTVNSETMISVTGATLIIASEIGKATQGEWFAVHYTVENKGDFRIQPVNRITTNLNLIDTQGRKYTPAGFFHHGFLAGAGFALQSGGGSDGRDWLDPGNTATTALAFDIPLDASGLRLRSEAGNFEVDLVDGAGRPDLEAVQTPTPVATITPTPVSRAAAKALPEGQTPIEFLRALMEEQFAGFTNRPCPDRATIVNPCKDKLEILYLLDVRPFRGGNKIIIVFEVDEVKSLAVKRRDMENQMWEAYRALFTSPAGNTITDAIMTGQALHVLRGGRGQLTLRGQADSNVIYKTRVTRDKAATIDWSTRPSDYTSCIVHEAGGISCESDYWDIATLHRDYRWDVPPATEP